MQNLTCWTCGKRAEVCHRCNSEWAKMEGCGPCEGTGYRCPDGDLGWEGTFFTAHPDVCGLVENWIQAHPKDDPETLTRNNIPFQGEEELSHLAFATNFKCNRELLINNESLRRLRWYVHCRDLAIEAGGDEPRIMRMPSYVELMKG